MSHANPLTSAVAIGTKASNPASATGLDSDATVSNTPTK
jgi:hypothetical protein